MLLLMELSGLKKTVFIMHKIVILKERKFNRSKELQTENRRVSIVAKAFVHVI